MAAAPSHTITTFEDAVNAGVMIVGDAQNNTFVLDGKPVTLPACAELLAYVAAVAQAYTCWADQPEQPAPPLTERDALALRPADAYIPIQALPMRVAELRPLPGQAEAPAQELTAILRSAPRTILLGEPGVGKTSALERLAWLLATGALAAAETGAHPWPCPSSWRWSATGARPTSSRWSRAPATNGGKESSH